MGPLMHRIQHTLDEHVTVGGKGIQLRTSLGVAISDENETAEDVLARASRSTRVGWRRSPAPTAAAVG